MFCVNLQSKESSRWRETRNSRSSCQYKNFLKFQTFFRYLYHVRKVVPFREFTTIPCIPWLDSHLRDTQSLDRRTVEWLEAVDRSEMRPDGVGSPILHVFTHLAWQNRHVGAPQYHSWGYTAVGYSVRMIRANLQSKESFRCRETRNSRTSNILCKI